MIHKDARYIVIEERSHARPPASSDDG
jgi:hypothetical protein